jgi:hypothetical protein
MNSQKIYFPLIIVFFKLLLIQYSLFSKKTKHNETTSIFENKISAFIDQNQNSNTVYYELLNRKTNTLNLSETIIMYVHSKKKNNKKHMRSALERLYTISPDAHLTELTLWQLGLVYENIKEYALAKDIFYTFKKIFPSSQYYNSARYREIINSHKISLEYAFDDTQNEETIELCKQFIVDYEKNNNEIIQKNIKKIILIICNAYKEKIKKYTSIANLYTCQFSYMKKHECLYGSLMRLSELYDIATEAIVIIHSKQNDQIKTFLELFENIKKEIKQLLESHEFKLPDDKNFKELYHETIDKLKKNHFLYQRELDKTIKIIEKKIQ